MGFIEEYPKPFPNINMSVSISLIWCYSVYVEFYMMLLPYVGVYTQQWHAISLKGPKCTNWESSVVL